MSLFAFLAGFARDRISFDFGLGLSGGFLRDNLHNLRLNYLSLIPSKTRSPTTINIRCLFSMNQVVVELEQVDRRNAFEGKGTPRVVGKLYKKRAWFKHLYDSANCSGRSFSAWRKEGYNIKNGEVFHGHKI